MLTRLADQSMKLGRKPFIQALPLWVRLTINWFRSRFRRQVLGMNVVIILDRDQGENDLGYKSGVGTELWTSQTSAEIMVRDGFAHWPEK